MKFELLHTDGAARRGRMTFPRGVVETPAFMPVGTYGTVKAVTPEELHAAGSRIILGNTFHLMLRPGVDVIRAHGGLHEFMGWPGPLLTDSGGFQVWSLKTLRKVDEQGVEFRSPVDGDLVTLTPESAVTVQHHLDADVVMVLDECTAYPVGESGARASMDLSLRWAARSRRQFDTLKPADSSAALFGIVQGGVYAPLRRASMSGLAEIGFDGYAVGGLAVGESESERLAVLESLEPADAYRAPTLPHGCGHTAGSDPGGRPRDGYLRLRDSDPPCAQRPALYPRRNDQHSQRPLPQRYRPGGSRLLLPHLPRLQPRLHPAPAAVQRDSRFQARHGTQPALLPQPHGRDARRH